MRSERTCSRQTYCFFSRRISARARAAAASAAATSVRRASNSRQAACRVRVLPLGRSPSRSGRSARAGARESRTAPAPGSRAAAAAPSPIRSGRDGRTVRETDRSARGTPCRRARCGSRANVAVVLEQIRRAAVSSRATSASATRSKACCVLTDRCARRELRDRPAARTETRPPSQTLRIVVSRNSTPLMTNTIWIASGATSSHRSIAFQISRSDSVRGSTAEKRAMISRVRASCRRSSRSARRSLLARRRSPAGSGGSRATAARVRDLVLRVNLPRDGRAIAACRPPAPRRARRRAASATG